jgi:hypothetical protein
MSTLGLILLIVLIVILLGGVGPHFYPGAPWQPGYGFGWGANGLLTILLIIIVVLLLTGRLG